MIRYLKYRLKWKLAPYINFKSPVHIDLELNTNCNQRCISCWHSKKDTPFAPAQMSPEVAKKYLREAALLGVMSVKFNLRGEPLLYPYLRQIVNYAKELKFVDIMINTNGILLDYGMAQKLHGLTTVIISVDSFDEMTYRKIHNCSRSDWLSLMKNLVSLRKLRFQHRLPFKVKLNYHINEINQKQLKNDIDYHVDNFSMFPLVMRQTQNREGKHISTYKKGKRKKRCPHMMRRITITANEKFYPCCVCYNEPEDIKCNSPFKKGAISLKDEMSHALAVIGFLRKLYSKRKIYKEACLSCTSGDIYK